MKAQRIVHLIFSLQTGGSENLLVDIVNEQVQTSDVTLIIINRKVEENLLSRIDKRVRVENLNRTEGSRFNYLFLLKLWRLLFSINPHAIHCHQTNCIPLLPFFRNKTVVTIHDVGYACDNVRKYRKVFSISNAVADDLRKARIDSAVITNGINFSSYTRRDNYSFDAGSQFKVIQVSRLMHEKKGQDIMLQAMSVLVNDYGIKNIVLDFVGGGDSEEYLKALTSDLGLDSHINFLNSRDRRWVQQNLHSYHLLIQPSRYEGFGLTVVEGIAAGVPVVASDIEGPAEILKGVSSGFLFKNEAVDELAHTIMRVMHLYESGEIEVRCNASYVKTMEDYSITKTAKEYLDNYALQ